MFSQDTMLRHHLQYNHFPAVSAIFIPAAIEAIEACEDGDYSREITLPNGIVLKAHEIVEQLHLDDFVSAELRDIDIPEDFPVQPVNPVEIANAVTCGTCGLSWDDSIPTSYTPAPSGRCPFEAFHA